MAHEITQGSHPHIVKIRVWDELTQDDMTCAEELGLNKGTPLAVFLDVSEMNRALPSGFLDSAKESWFVHDNVLHLAMYSGSGMLNTIANMVGKLTRRKDKISTHDTREMALDHLVRIVASR